MLMIAICALGFLCVAVSADDRLGAAIGRKLFLRAWVPAPSSTLANDGLGPLFNARSCASCHDGLDRTPMSVGADGRVTGDARVMRLSDGAGRPDPVYGAQLQTAAVPGFSPEGHLMMTPSGLRADGLAYGRLAPETRQGLRDAPALRGLGLLERVPDETIIALERQVRSDGVSGRAHVLPSGRVGRFGWKASAATIAEQTAVAFALDLGMSTASRPDPAGDCTDAETACRSGPHGGDARGIEITGDIIAMLSAYLASVEPRPGAPDPGGERLFRDTGCASCHLPELTTRDGEPVHAFTDLLLHDMGAGLDGGATEPGVKPTEWRTAPLWGLSRSLDAGGGLLHDGRARSVDEAVRWHGGEGAPARDRFGALSRSDRARLVDYVLSR